MRGNNLGKMVKSCMKITKSAFLGQNNVGGGMGRKGGGGGGAGGGGGEKPIFWVVAGVSPQSPPLGETLLFYLRFIACLDIDHIDGTIYRGFPYMIRKHFIGIKHRLKAFFYMKSKT